MKPCWTVLSGIEKALPPSPTQLWEGMRWEAIDILHIDKQGLFYFLRENQCVSLFSTFRVEMHIFSLKCLVHFQGNLYQGDLKQENRRLDQVRPVLMIFVNNFGSVVY
jgi:hypothetical protein